MYGRRNEAPAARFAHLTHVHIYTWGRWPPLLISARHFMTDINGGDRLTTSTQLYQFRH
jgi:hypothetical protein